MHELSMLCAAVTLGAAMIISTEVSARGGHHGGGHHGGHHRGIMGVGTTEAGTEAGVEAVGTEAVGTGAVGTAAVTTGTGSGVAGESWNGLPIANGYLARTFPKTLYSGASDHVMPSDRERSQRAKARVSLLPVRRGPAKLLARPEARAAS